MTLGEITDVLNAMGMGDVITFPDGSIAARTEDGWEITLPSDDNPGSGTRKSMDFPVGEDYVVRKKKLGEGWGTLIRPFRPARYLTRGHGVGISRQSPRRMRGGVLRRGVGTTASSLAASPRSMKHPIGPPPSALRRLTTYSGALGMHRCSASSSGGRNG